MRRITFQPSDVKSPVMGRLNRLHFLDERTVKVYLTHNNWVSSINPDLALHTVEAQRL